MCDLGFVNVYLSEFWNKIIRFFNSDEQPIIWKVRDLT